MLDLCLESGSESLTYNRHWKGWIDYITLSGISQQYVYICDIGFMPNIYIK